MLDLRRLVDVPFPGAGVQLRAVAFDFKEKTDEALPRERLRDAGDRFLWIDVEVDPAHVDAAADWLKVSPEGYGTLDVKVTMETDDGAIIHATYSGRLQFDTMAVYATPLFHTGDERYAWMNRIQAVAKGTFQPDGTLVYEMFELR